MHEASVFSFFLFQKPIFLVPGYFIMEEFKAQAWQFEQ